MAVRRPTAPADQFDFQPPTIPSLNNLPEMTPEVVAAAKEAMVEAGMTPRLFKFVFDKYTFLFRSLTRTDYHPIQAYIKTNEMTATQDEVDKLVCEKALIFPQEVLHPLVWDQLPAGLQQNLANQIRARSGFFIKEMDQTGYMELEFLGGISAPERPAKEVIQQIKAENPGKRLSLVLLDTDYFLVRPLSKREWAHARENYREDLDFGVALLGTVWSKEYPSAPDFESKLAGFSRELSDVILNLSGFNVTPVVEEV